MTKIEKIMGALVCGFVIYRIWGILENRIFPLLSNIPEFFNGPFTWARLTGLLLGLLIVVILLAVAGGILWLFVSALIEILFKKDN